MPSLPLPPDIPEGLEHLLPVFVAEMVKDCAQLVQLAAAAGAAGLDDLAEHAHAMRGKAGLFGEHRLYDLLTAVEQLALSGQDAGLAKLVELVVERSAELEVYGRPGIAAEQP